MYCFFLFFVFFIFTVDASVKDQKQQQSGKDSQLSASLLSDIKKAIGAEKTNRLFVALQTYKNTNDYEQMVSTVVGLLTERDEDIVLLKRESFWKAFLVFSCWILLFIFLYRFWVIYFNFLIFFQG